MKYQKKFPICPYQSQGTGKCSHKGCSTCTYLKHPWKCELYNEFIERLTEYPFDNETKIKQKRNI